MNWTVTAALLLALAVILGAFGAHGLRPRLDAEAMRVYETGVMYHFLNALGILILSVLPRAGAAPRTAINPVCGILLAGIVLFSGSLYLLVATGIRLLGVITPLGGLLFIAGWLLAAWRLR